MFLVAFTVLGLMGLLLNSMARGKDSADRRTAAILASDFAERIAANMTGYEARAYNGLAFTPGTTVPVRPTCTDGICTPAQIAQNDWIDMIGAVSQRLPGGAVWVTTKDDAENARVLITIGWTDPRRETDVQSGVGAAVDQRCRDRGIPDDRLDYRCYDLATLP